MKNESNIENTTTILPLQEEHFEELYLVQDAVSREKKFLSFTSGPPKIECLKFFQNIVDNNICAYIALLDDRVVGWCDIHPYRGDACQHIGILGVGLSAHARHKGIGRKLLNISIADAQNSGLSRIELEVRVDNIQAVKLYKSLGFTKEGVSIGRYRIDGVFYDLYRMALISDAK